MAIAAVAVVVVVVEVALTVYDMYTAAETVADEEAPLSEKVVAVGGAAAGIVLPGGGYGTAAKATVKVVSKADDIYDTYRAAKAGTKGLKGVSRPIV